MINTIKINTGYGSRKLLGIQTSGNTDLSVFFNDVEILIRTNSRGEYFFNEKHTPLPLVCLEYENIYVISAVLAPIVPLYGELDLDTECEVVHYEMLVFDPHTDTMKPTKLRIERGRAWFSFNQSTESYSAYIGVV